jgi:L-asparaginase
MSKVPQILMLYTGGTIGMVKAKDSDSLMPFDFEYLLQRIPEIGMLPGKFDADSLDKPIDSSDIKPEHWLRLAKRIREGQDQYDGFVILHGSDTMAYTASALSFLLHDLKKPVILTGSQLPIGVARSDARENLITALEIAMLQKVGEPIVQEVCIYFEYDLLRGNRTHKISAEDFDAFASLNYPRLAEAGVHIKMRENYLLRTHRNVSQAFEPAIASDVAILTVFPGMQPTYVKAVLEQDVRAVLIRSFGSGNAPTDDWFIGALQAFLNKGKHLINVSQCSSGTVSLGKYQASEAMQKMGVLGAADMTFEAAITKAMYLLAQNLSPKEFTQFYQKNLAGELTD